MKNKTIKLLSLLICLLMAVTSFTQDRIYLFTGDVLEGRIDSIAEKAVVFYGNKDGLEVRQEIPKLNILRIIRADGSEEELEPTYKDPDFYVGQLKRSLKYHLFSALLGHTSFSYEQNLHPGRSVEFNLGIIGLGNNFDLGTIQEENTYRDVSVDPFGFHVGLGYKFYSKPVVRSNGWRYRHLLQGWYLMPKVLAGYYQENTFVYELTSGGLGTEESIERKNRIFGGVMAYVGKQIVFSGTYLLEWHLGLGLGFDNDEDSQAHHYVVSMSSNALMLGGGLRLGVLF